MEFIRIPLTEAIKHLSPKTEEEVISSFKNMTPQEQLKTGISNDLPDLVKNAIKNGVDVNQRIITKAENIWRSYR